MQNDQMIEQSDVQAEMTLEIQELGSVSGDTEKFFVGFEQNDPFLYWS